MGRWRTLISHRRRLAVRLVTLTVLASSVVTLVLTAIQLYRSYEWDVGNIERNLEQIRLSHLDSIASSYWVLDRGQTRLLLEGLLRIPELEQLRIIGSKGVYMAVGSAPAESAALHRTYPLVHPYQGRDVELGRLEVTATLAGARRRVLEQAGIILLSNALKTFLVAAFMLYVFRRLVTRHLDVIGRFTRSVAGGDFTRELQLPRTASPPGREDELDDLVDSLSAMQAEIRSSMSALQESERRYRALVETMSDGLGIVDRLGRITYANDRLCEMSGYERRELLGEHVSTALLDPVGAAELEARMGPIRNGSTEAFGGSLVRRDGQRLDVVLAPRRLNDAHGVMMGMFAVVTDVTALKNAERRLQQLNVELEARVRARTAELEAAQEQLVAQQKLATVGQLTATVSHELRNPLGTIRISVFSLRERLRGADDALVRTLDRIERNVLRCDDIVGDLLGYSRTRQPQDRRMAVGPWLRGVVEEQACPDWLTLEYRLEDGDAEAWIDPDLLQRAVINVVENAVQAMADAPVPERRLTVRTVAEGERMEIRITDTGPGMTPAVLARIFEPLYSTKVYGVGLGMPTVRQIMEQERGGIEVDSRPGQGTQVTLWLPLAKPDTVPPADPAEQPSRPN